MKRTQATTPILLHGHKNGLLTIGADYNCRLMRIRRLKGRAYRALRLARMRPLSEMEVAALPQEVQDTLAAYHRTHEAFAWAVLWACAQERNQAQRELDQRAAARDQAIRAHAAELAAWHKSVCSPECKACAANNWNIFGEGGA